MNPFDQPPTTPPVSVDPAPRDPAGPIGPEPGRHRGRVALVALAAVGLVVGGLVGVSQLVSADRPAVDESAAATPDDGAEPIDPVDEGDDEGDSEGPSVDGEIVIDDGDGDPIVIDLGEGTVDGRSFESIAECLGLPAFLDGPMVDDFPFDRFEELPLDDLELGELDLDGLDLDGLDEGALGELGLFGSGGAHVTVLGPDGVQIIDLGEGDGSVTITQEDGEITITTDGDATVTELPDLLGELGELGEWREGVPGEFDPEQLFDELFDEGVFDELPAVDEMLDGTFEGFEPVDPAAIEACLDAADQG